MATTHAKLNNGVSIPLLGLGCWMSTPVDGDNPETYEMVSNALKTGYRHLDTAAGYGNERAVGKAIRDSGIPREEIFLTTKLGNQGHADVEAHLDKSLSELGLDYVDLYLMHWPMAKTEDGTWLKKSQSPTYIETWKSMEKLAKTGKVRALGVSNFSVKTLSALLEQAEFPPAVVQVESNIYRPQNSLDKYCKEKGILLTAYCPIGQPKPGVGSKVLKEPLLKELSEKYNKPLASVAISWLLQRGNWSTVPKSANPDRMKQNLEVFKLDQADFDALSKVHEQPGKLMISCGFNGKDVMKEGELFGWTLEELGWEQLD